MKIVKTSLYQKGIEASLIIGLLLISLSVQSQTCFNAYFSSEFDYDGCTVIFDNQSIGDISEWQWQFGDGAVSYDENPVHNYYNAGCYNVILTVTTPSGESQAYSNQVCPTCIDGSTGTGSFNVSIDGPPIVFTGQSSNFISTVSGGAPPYSYWWNLFTASGSYASGCSQGDGNTSSANFYFESGFGGCDLGGTYVVDLEVVDANGNVSTGSHQVQVGNQPESCEMEISGLREIGELIKFRIKSDFIGDDCYDVYPFWTWDYGDNGAQDGPDWLWKGEHVYTTNGLKTVTATGCTQPTWELPGSCIEISKVFEIGTPDPPFNGPNFSISPSDQIMATIGEPIPVPLSVVINNGLPQNFPGELEINKYDIEWTIINSSTGTVVKSGFYNQVLPSQINAPIYNFDFTPTADMYGCLDVVLKLYPWGYYNGLVDVGCDGDLTPADSNTGQANNDQCTYAGQFNQPCNGILGALTDVNLGVGYLMSQWDIPSSFPGLGCVGEDVEKYGEEFPFTVRSNCLIDVQHELINVTGVAVTDGCDPYLEVEAELGAVKFAPVPSGAPCGGSQRYMSYEWKAYSIDDLTTELANFYLGPQNSKCIKINREHSYFQQFQPGQVVAFISEITVEDYFGFKDTYTKLVGIDLPIKINIPSVIKVCPGTQQVPLYDDGPLFSGGSGSYNLPSWQGPTNIFVQPLDHYNPILNLGTGGQQTSSFNVVVTDDAGCSTNKDVKVIISPISVQINQDLDRMCVGDGLHNILEAYVSGGSGNYEYEWSVQGASTDILSDPYILNPTVSPTQGGILDFAFWASDDNGCSSYDFITIDVSDTYVYAELFDAKDLYTVCNGASVQLGENVPYTEIIPPVI